MLSINITTSGETISATTLKQLQEMHMFIYMKHYVHIYLYYLV